MAEPMVVVGLMSGTSLDGISAAVVRFTDDGVRINAELLAYDVSPYGEPERTRLTRALREGTPEEFCRLNFDLGEWLARAAINVMAQCGVPRGDIAAVCTHGQTLWHVPGHSTWQTGESAVIAERTGRPVIADFRVRDMAAGGQGAPLVPIADSLLFAADSDFRALQNLGGIGNVTVVPPRERGSPNARSHDRERARGGERLHGGELVREEAERVHDAEPSVQDAERLTTKERPTTKERATFDFAGVRAFDTGPGVVVIDGIVRLLDPSRRYDEDGALARQGCAINRAVERALADPYFAAPPPKSTGRELFTPAYIAGFADWCREAQPNATGPDLVATAVAFTARSIADAYDRFLPEPIADVVVSGGGARNPALVDAIQSALGAGRRVVRFDDLFFDGEAKEAVAFALMGYLHLRGLPGNVPPATGAAGPRILGKLTPA